MTFDALGWRLVPSCVSSAYIWGGAAQRREWITDEESAERLSCCCYQLLPRSIEYVGYDEEMESVKDLRQILVFLHVLSQVALLTRMALMEKVGNVDWSEALYPKHQVVRQLALHDVMSYCPT